MFLFTIRFEGDIIHFYVIFIFNFLQYFDLPKHGIMAVGYSNDN